jgi:lysosomal acid lipase/cholesteryl ester hydrolase
MCKFGICYGHNLKNQFVRLDLNPIRFGLGGAQEYWNWSWDELAAYDLPSMIDLVFDVTKSPIYYIGHSQVQLRLRSTPASLWQFRLSCKIFLGIYNIVSVSVGGQGTLIALAALSEGKLSMDRIVAAALLAPVAYIASETSPLVKLVNELKIDKVS